MAAIWTKSASDLITEPLHYVAAMDFHRDLADLDLGCGLHRARVISLFVERATIDFDQTVGTTISRRWLRAGNPQSERVLTSLEHIVAASHRAADIVTSVRSMFNGGSAFQFDLPAVGSK
jgi:hypothetical protein